MQTDAKQTTTIKPGQKVEYRWYVGSYAMKTATVEIRRGTVRRVIRREGKTFYKILGASAPVEASRIVEGEE